MKKTLYHLIVAASLPVLVQTASAQTTILTDNFTTTSGNDVNGDLGARQTGTYATSTWTKGALGGGGGIQTQNTTYVGQPGGPALPLPTAGSGLSATLNDHYLMMYNGGWVYNNLALNSTVVGGQALSISFKIYQGVYNHQDPTLWTSFSIGNNGTVPSPNQAGQFGFLVQPNQGLWVFNGNNSALDHYNNVGFLQSDAWTVIASGNADGTGSPFDGTTYIQLYSNDDPANGMTGMGLLWSGQLTTALSSNDQVGFLDFSDGGWNENGIGDFVMSTVPAPEPSTYALLGGGLLSLLAFRRRLSA